MYCSALVSRTEVSSDALHELENISLIVYRTSFLDETVAVVYVLSSLLAFDPWHLVTSFVQYLLLTPTFICILSM